MRSIDLRERCAATLHRRNARARDRVVMQDMQRIAAFFHVDAREAAPDAAHGIKRPAFERTETREIAKPIIHKLARLVGIVLRDVHEPQGSERECQRLTRAAVLHRHHVEAAAAEIGDKTVGFRRAGQNAFGGKARLFLAR